MEIKLPIEVREIQNFLPHRFPFLLLDRVIAACAGISGSTKIGSYCIIGGAAMFVGHIEIADKTTIGGGTAVTHSIKEPGHYATCYPLQTHKEWARNAVHVRHLSDMAKKIKQLEQSLEALQPLISKEN